MMVIVLTDQQKESISKAKDWWKKKTRQTFEISGIAGSGKTTIVYCLIKELNLHPDDVLFTAYVGKATLALARKGNRAQTIHSTIYSLQETPKKNSDGEVIISNGREVTTLTFIKKKELPPNIKLIVVDEGGMVSENIAKDLLSFGIPIIVLGDNNQLPPVFGESFFLQNPDSVLTEPMRQALDSPIIQLAQKVLNDEYIKYGKYGESCHVIRKDMITDHMLTDSDIVICGKNATRMQLNKHVRHNILKIDKEHPVIGEKMICRQNNWKIPPIDNNIFLINGLIGYVVDVSLESFNGKSLAIDFRPEFLEDIYFSNVIIDYQHILNPTNRVDYFRNINKFEYAYAITCHLAQGSEADSVFIYNEQMGTRDYYKRWLYTAITRSQRKLILAM